MKKEVVKTQRSPAVIALLLIIKILGGIVAFVFGSLGNQQRTSKPTTSYDDLIERAKIDPSLINHNRSENH